MSSAETPILTNDGIQEEDKIEILTEPLFKKAFICALIFWWSLTTAIFVLAFFIRPWLCVFSLLFIVAGFIPGLGFNDKTEVTINTKNNTLIFHKKKFFNCICKKKPQIFDLTRIEKIRIMINCDRKQSDDNFKIIYKDGGTDNIAEYFKNCSKAKLLLYQNFFRKYVIIEERISSPLVICYTTNNGNINIPPNGTIVYNSGMINQFPQNSNEQGYTPSGGVYNNVNGNGSNQNCQANQYLPNEEDVIKPSPNTKENYDAPSPPQ